MTLTKFLHLTEPQLPHLSSVDRRTADLRIIGVSAAECEKHLEQCLHWASAQPACIFSLAFLMLLLRKGSVYR